MSGKSFQKYQLVKQNYLLNSSLVDFYEKTKEWNLLISSQSVELITDICARQIYDRIMELRKTNKLPVVFIDVLKGATFYGTEIRKLLDTKYKLSHSYETITVKSYGDGQIQENEIQVSCSFNFNKYKNHIVVLFDELLDGGRTMEEAVKFLINGGVSRENIITSVAYIKNTSCGVYSSGVRRIVSDLDVYGVHVPNQWCNGTGLDDGGLFRFIPHLWGTKKIEGIPSTEDDIFVFGSEDGCARMYFLMQNEVDARCTEILGTNKFVYNYE